MTGAATLLEGTHRCSSTATATSAHETGLDPVELLRAFASRALSLSRDQAPVSSVGESATAPAQSPNELEFVEFHRLTHRGLGAYVQQSTGDASATEDVVQEAYLRFLRSCTPTRQFQPARAYLFRIATNLLRDRHRRRDLEFPVEQDDDRLEDEREVAPQQTAALGRDVRRLLLRLSERDRQLLWLAHVEQMSHREIAAVLGLRELSIRPMLFRAKHRFRALLQRAGALPPASGPAGPEGVSK